MRKFFASLAAMVALAAAGPMVTAPPAEAFSHSYCEATLRGQTGNPYGSNVIDNDAKFVWDYYEETYGVNIVSSVVTQSLLISGSYSGPGLIRVKWVFYRANGSGYYSYFRCEYTPGQGEVYYDWPEGLPKASIYN